MVLARAPSPLSHASRIEPERYGEAGLELWMLRVPDLDEQQLDCSLLDAQERHRADRLALTGQRLPFLAAHLLLRHALSERLGLRPQGVRYVRERCPHCGGPNGRPALDTPTRSPHFSLSRSGDVVLVGIASVPIGVDVQAYADDGTAADISVLLHPAEREELHPAAPSAFTRLWARNEAYLKAIGTGLGHGLDAAYLEREARARTRSGWNVVDVPAPAGYAAAAALGEVPNN